MMLLLLLRKTYGGTDVKQGPSGKFKVPIINNKIRFKS